MKRYNLINKIIALLIFLIAMQDAFSQIDYSDFIVSGELNSYLKVAVKERVPVPLVANQENNIKYTKRVIRCIDVRQKMNKAMAWPRSSFAEHLSNALMEGLIVPYKTDSMSTPMTHDEFMARMSYQYEVFYPTDPEDPNIGIDSVITELVDANSIQKFWIMEEWNFDYELGVFKPRILGFAPVYERQFSFGKAPEQPLCWIRMDDNTRAQLDRWEYFNRANDAARLSYDDLFQMRLFDSYIVFENNVFDLMISDFEEYKDNGEAALVKSEEVKNDLFIFEHDLWQF